MYRDVQATSSGGTRKCKEINKLISWILNSLPRRSRGQEESSDSCRDASYHMQKYCTIPLERNKAGTICCPERQQAASFAEGCISLRTIHYLITVVPFSLPTSISLLAYQWELVHLKTVHSGQRLPTSATLLSVVDSYISDARQRDLEEIK